MVGEFGSGLYLDESLDFSVDTTGDLRTVDGVDELEKDLSVQMITSLQQYLGQPPSSNLNAQVFRTASNIATADARVASVNTNKSTVSFNRTRDEITLKLVVRTTSGEQELVFEV
jgi:hypothetical protein